MFLGPSFLKGLFMGRQVCTDYTQFKMGSRQTLEMVSSSIVLHCREEETMCTGMGSIVFDYF